MATFTSSLPDELLLKLAQVAKELKMPKNKLIEKALELYLLEIEKAQYANSFRRAAKDSETLQIAEEGMADYFKMLQEFDEE